MIARNCLNIAILSVENILDSISGGFAVLELLYTYGDAEDVIQGARDQTRRIGTILRTFVVKSCELTL